ncbi:MAG: cysteine-rich CWC family protein [Rhodospirillales bacterium]
MRTCKEVHRLVAEAEDRKMGFAERVAVGAHLVICVHCRGSPGRWIFCAWPCAGSRGTMPEPGAVPPAGDRCALCGAGFECGARLGRDHCWCASLPGLKTIQQGRACLCPACLAEELREELRQAGTPPV